MPFPFGRGGTPAFPFVAMTKRDLFLRFKRTRLKDCPQAVTVYLKVEGVVWLGDRDVLPLGTLLKGLGFTLDDCRAALEEEG